MSLRFPLLKKAFFRPSSMQNSNEDSKRMPAKAPSFDSMNLDERKSYANRLLQQEKGKIPIILEKDETSTVNFGSPKKMYVVLVIVV